MFRVFSLPFKKYAATTDVHAQINKHKMRNYEQMIFMTTIMKTKKINI